MARVDPAVRPSCRSSSTAPSTASLAKDARLRDAKVRVALLDLAHGEPPALAHHHGDAPIYPASVVKFVYLMAAYRWQEQGRLRIEGDFDRELSEMIRQSSNQATRKVFARLTDTEPGPELPPDAYRDFRERRLAVKRWLDALGIDDLHCVNPTYDGNGDLFGRDAQFIRDASVAAAASAARSPNRQAMTAIGTAKLLALLATDRALTPEDSADRAPSHAARPEGAAATSRRASRAAPRASAGSRSMRRAARGARSTPTPASCGTSRGGRW